MKYLPNIKQTLPQQQLYFKNYMILWYLEVFRNGFTYEILTILFQGVAESCLAIFLPALVMGNFMVLNLFLALLLNSFNCEELKSRKEVCF